MDVVVEDTALAPEEEAEEVDSNNNNHAGGGDNCTVAVAVDKTGKKEPKELEGYRYQFLGHL